MKYKYRVEIASSNMRHLEKMLNDFGAAGYKLFSALPINNITGITMQGLPKQELTYHLIFEKSEKTAED
jgi:hypothetical protein